MYDVMASWRTWTVSTPYCCWSWVICWSTWAIACASATTLADATEYCCWYASISNCCSTNFCAIALA